MTKASFIFNIIVTRLELTNHKIDEPQNLLVFVDFNKSLIKVTSSSINVSQFDEVKNTVYKSEPASLRDYLESNGLPIMVRYCGVLLGRGRITLPESFLEQIDVDMDYLTHADTCKILNLNMRQVGSMDVMCLLTIKCKSQDDYHGPCKNACGSIGKTDIVILMRNIDIDSMASKSYLTEPEEQEYDIPLSLDHSSFNRRISQSSEDTSVTEACVMLKALATECGQIIDSVLERITELSSSSPDISCHDADDDALLYINSYAVNDRIIPVPVTAAVDDTDINSLRYCPICLNSMSWLPKYAYCPRCCAQPMPLLDTEPIHTADQIVECYTEESEDDASKKLSTTTSEELAVVVTEPKKRIKNKTARCRNRCKCSSNKICSHCRVCKMYAELITPTDHKTSRNSDIEIPFVTNRPQLKNVLLELEFLFNQRNHKINKYGTKSEFEGDLNTKSL